MSLPADWSQSSLKGGRTSPAMACSPAFIWSEHRAQICTPDGRSSFRVSWEWLMNINMWSLRHTHKHTHLFSERYIQNHWDMQRKCIHWFPQSERSSKTAFGLMCQTGAWTGSCLHPCTPVVLAYRKQGLSQTKGRLAWAFWTQERTSVSQLLKDSSSLYSLKFRKISSSVSHTHTLAVHD